MVMKNKVGLYVKTKRYVGKVVWSNGSDSLLVFKYNGGDIGLKRAYSFDRFSFCTYFSDPEIEAYIQNPFF